ncbi:hypothetical protein ACL02T_30455 [Pseudonocardia sp. RS010]|uniref:hypothetical protein n=1 Tax=Pseudonocardia sp. RS010 TaxID=3385979 RepID=UPI0039A03871
MNDLSANDTGGATAAERAETRAAPLPEEARVTEPDEDRYAEAEGILADSEERIAEADAGRAPSDAADEHRRSEDTA